MCPKLNELLSWNGPTVHVCCFKLARASTKTFVSRIHIRQPSPKNSGKKYLLQPKNSLAGSLVSRGITVYSLRWIPAYDELQTVETEVRQVKRPVTAVAYKYIQIKKENDFLANRGKQNVLQKKVDKCIIYYNVLYHKMKAFTEQPRRFGILQKPIFCKGVVSIKLCEPESKPPDVKGRCNGKKKINERKIYKAKGGK